MTTGAPAPTNPGSGRGCLLVMLVPALIALVFAFVLAGQKLAFRWDAVKVHGTVVGHVKKSARNSKGRTQTTYYEIVEYRDAGGRTRRVTASVGRSPERYAVGERIAVYYDAEHPDDARVDTFWDFWAVPLLLFVFSAPFVGHLSKELYGRRQERLRESAPPPD